MKRLRRTSLTTCKDIEDLVQQLQEVQNQLSEVNVELPEAVFIDHFVENLTSEFDPWVTSFFNHHVIVPTDGFTDTVTFDEVVRAATEFERRNKSVLDESVTSLMVGQDKGDTHKIVGDTMVLYQTTSRTIPYCTHCKIKGHKRENCFVLFPHLKKEFFKKKTVNHNSRRGSPNKRPRTETSVTENSTSSDNKSEE
jgi:hypothetical protein